MNLAKAAIRYRKAAEQGDASAQFNLGIMYDYGRGVTQDYAQAALWYRKAAEQGLAAAQYNLGVAYHEGQGVPQDYVQAAVWYRRAAEQGDAAAQFNLGAAYFDGQGVPQDYAEAYSWLNRLVSAKPEGINLDDAIRLRNDAASHLTDAVLAHLPPPPPPKPVPVGNDSPTRMMSVGKKPVWPGWVLIVTGVLGGLQTGDLATFAIFVVGGIAYINRSGKLATVGISLIVMVRVIAILTLPFILNVKKNANEASATQTMHTIAKAEFQYNSTYPQLGFTCSIAELGGDPKSGAPTAQSAQLLQSDLASGEKAGYTFAITNCDKTTINNQDHFNSFEVTAVPQSVGHTGDNGFCADESNTIRKDPTGGTNCTQPVQ